MIGEERTPLRGFWIQLESAYEHLSYFLIILEMIYLVCKSFSVGETLNAGYKRLKEVAPLSLYGKTYVRKEVPAILKKHYFLPVSNFAGTGSITPKNKAFEVQSPCLLTAGSDRCLNQTMEETQHGKQNGI